MKKLFQILVRSTLLYGASTWSLRFLDEIEKVNLAYFKKMLRLPLNTPNCCVRLEVNEPHLAVTVFK